MDIFTKLREIWQPGNQPFLIHDNTQIRFSDIAKAPGELAGIKPGDVVALIGDFDPCTLRTFLHLVERRTIVVPLTAANSQSHEELLAIAGVDWIIENGEKRKVSRKEQKHELVAQMAAEEKSAIVLFSSGITGKPKGILLEISALTGATRSSNSSSRILTFLLFDHIGGLYTLTSMLNGRTLIAPQKRTPEAIMKACAKHKADTLPTTPTFLRLLLLGGLVPDHVPASLRTITYGTELMDASTLTKLCKLLPKINFWQTYGMSELGIFKIQSEARDSLFMRIADPGCKTRVVDGQLHILSQRRMRGYLNAASPFDKEGWYNTKDIVEQKGEFFRIVGRNSDLINVGGQKFMASQVEEVALQIEGVVLAKAEGKSNPITGQHAELVVQLAKPEDFDPVHIKRQIGLKLPPHMVPLKISCNKVPVSHRFKRG
ncbi:MAG: fatty acid--CoA ligase family protein [Betaproteobacteria bacterium]|nr:fatty acid--CoA ligase family protein [Betaproteobacteria bacterium]